MSSFINPADSNLREIQNAVSLAPRVPVARPLKRVSVRYSTWSCSFCSLIILSAFLPEATILTPAFWAHSTPVAKVITKNIKNLMKFVFKAR